jgi:glycopeptide antibiotics resistance protein
MSRWAKKFLVLLPVIALGIIYLYGHYNTYHQLKSKRLLFTAITILLLYGWIFFEVITRKQKNFFQTITQAGFFVFIFMVLTVTGYFILFREVSAHDWWHKMMVRIDHRDHVNFQLFKMFKIYKLWSMQVVGNFIMLLPLGIFLPLLYKKASNFYVVLIISLLVSATIELLQLMSSFRSADVDDIFLNTLGACTGYFIYKLISLAIKASHKAPAILVSG